MDMYRAGVGVLLGGAIVAASCSSAGEAAIEPTPSSATSSTANAAPSTSTSVSEVPTTSVAEVDARPSAISDLPAIEFEEVAGAWGEPELVGDFAAIGLPSIVPGTRSMLFIEERGQVEEGCEGGIESLGRLTSYDLETGSSTVLIPELELTDNRFVLGPDGRFAIVAGCDANAWLAAVGNVDADGILAAFVELSSESEDRIWGGGNPGVSVTWANGGEVLFFNSTRVDAVTGERLDPVDDSSTARAHAELADGTRLVAAPSGEVNEFFWVDDGSGTLDEVTSTPPHFSAQSVSLLFR